MCNRTDAGKTFSAWYEVIYIFIYMYLQITLVKDSFTQLTFVLIFFH